MNERASTVVHRNGTDPSRAFQQALLLQQQGRLWEAERLFELVLNANARHFDSLYCLGVIRLQQGRFEDAARLFRRTIKIDRMSAEAQHYLAFALTGLERLEEAVRHYEKAIAIKPDVPEAHNNFGHALQRLGRFEAAIACYEKALAIKPDYAEARNNLGNALHLLDKSDEAITHYEKALLINPDYAEAHWNLANSLRALGRFDEAIARYAKAIAIRPDYIEAYNGLGNAFRSLGRHDEAIAQYQKALEIRPTCVDALINLGDVLVGLDDRDGAIAHYDKALATSPRNLDALTRRGKALAQLKRHDEAMRTFETALGIDPDHTPAFDALLASAIAACDWARTAKLSAGIAARITKGEQLDPFTLLGYCTDPSLHMACAKTYVRHHLPVAMPALPKRTTWRNEKIRLAYLAAGFHQHPTAYLSAELIEIHDRSRFEVIGISMGPDDGSDIRTRIVRAFDRFYDIQATTDHEAATLIADLHVDILVDRSGYTTDARPSILAYRPGPIQVNYLGYPGTLGGDFYDYVIADRIVLPFDQQPFYTEKIVHLPDCYQGNDTTRIIPPEIPTRAQAGLPAQGFVFCCFNNNYKITPQLFDIWMRLMRRIDGSVLWLLGDKTVAERNLAKEAAARGVDPARVVFADRVKHEQHLARHRLADLFLDTLPYNAHTTASDALWAGLPLVTCCGGSFAGRVAASLLDAVGLPDLITHSLEEYEALALRLATEPSRLRGFRERLKQNRLTHPLFNSDRYRRHIEAAYTTMWDRWQRGESAQSFAVEAQPGK